mmetsp:Transcript_10784/g.25722  ORF Transcript_10784/g.25722 Transcript_10784/m.25722 type:complete len:88 (-) Transcript_10784:1846-2109(-)
MHGSHHQTNTTDSTDNSYILDDLGPTKSWIRGVEMVVAHGVGRASRCNMSMHLQRNYLRKNNNERKQKGSEKALTNGWMDGWMASKG